MTEDELYAELDDNLAVIELVKSSLSEQIDVLDEVMDKLRLDVGEKIVRLKRHNEILLS